jgi:hypothetical protein
VFFRYDAIRDMELEYACGTGKSTVLGSIYEWVMNTSAEHLKRNADVMAHLIMKLGGASPNNNDDQYHCRNCGRNNVRFNCNYCGNSRNW